MESWSGPRIGFVVPRFKQSAVARNQVKRRLRELARAQILPTGLLADIVLRIRPEAYGASFDLLASDVAHAVTQLKQWHETIENHASRSNNKMARETTDTS